MFFVIILTIWTAMHLYAFWRMASVPFFVRHVPPWVLSLLGVFLWSCFLASIFAERLGAILAAQVLELVGGNWMGVLFLVVVCLLLTDVLTGFGYLVPHMAPQIRGWALVAASLLCAVALVQGLRAPLVRNYEVEIRSLPADRDGTVLVVASDLHVGGFRGERWLSARIDEINAQRPDLVVLAGDIVEGHGRSERELLSAVRHLSAPLGIWAVNGNHETYGGPGEGNGAVLEHAGFHVLRDQWAEASPGFVIAGVDDLTTRRRRLGRDAEFVDRALAGRPSGATTIFVSHSPLLAERVAGQGVALMLAAHTHGGQIWPLGYVVGRIYPLLGGRYEVGGMPVIVCRGTGTWGPWMRLWSRSELLRISLRRPAAEAEVR